MITIKFHVDPVISTHWPQVESEWKYKEFALAARSVAGTRVPSVQEIARWVPDSAKTTFQWVYNIGFDILPSALYNLAVKEIGKNMGPQDLNRMQWEIEKV